ncbi:TIGR01212 family radical SAM protein [Gammaproteobacteria bacterium]
MVLSDYVHTFGQSLLRRYGERVHKIAIHAGFTCPNRDGTKGSGGCSFCNNASFAPNTRHTATVSEQIAAGRVVIQKRTGARLYLAYFQAYTNTYATLEKLRLLYEEALAEPDVVGLSVGTRPDCVSSEVIALLAGYQKRGYEVWLELGLQSAFDSTLARVNRGHGFSEYKETLLAVHEAGLRVCTHLILGLPGETLDHYRETLDRVITLGVEGLKIHPLHVVRGTRLAEEWWSGNYVPLDLSEYVSVVSGLVRRTPPEVVFHRLTGTAEPSLLLAPNWCAKKWAVLNAITAELASKK